MRDRQEPLSHASASDPASSFTLYPRPRWTVLSIAALLCFVLFVLAVIVAGIIHPKIPPALVVTIVALPVAAAVLGAMARSGPHGAPARGSSLAMKLGIPAGIIVMMILLILPSLCRSSESANRVKCASNLRQIANAMSIYADAHGGEFPPTLETLARNSNLSPAAFVCPSSNDVPANIAKPADWGEAFQPRSHESSYVYLAGGRSKANVTSHSILAYEPPENHLDQGMNILFGDLSVEWFQKAAGNRIIAQQTHPTPPATRPADSGGNP